MERAVRRPPPVPAWRRLAPLVGLLLLGWVVSGLDGQRFLAALASVQLGHVAIGATLFSFNVFIKGLRWKRMLTAQAIGLPSGVALSTYLSAVFYGQFTIGRLGEFFRVEALLERGVSAGRALSSCVFDRVLDLYLVLTVGAVLGALVFGEAEAALYAAGLMLVATVAGLALVIAEAGAGPAWLGAGVARLEAALSPLPLLPRLLSSLRELLAGVRPLLSPLPLMEACLWTVVGWGGYFAALHALALGLGLSVGPIVLTAAATLAALSSLLPITVSGLGARELIYAELLGRHQVPGESAVLLALMHLALMTACVVVLGLFGMAARARQPAPGSAER